MIQEPLINLKEFLFDYLKSIMLGYDANATYPIFTTMKCYAFLGTVERSLRDLYYIIFAL